MPTPPPPFTIFPAIDLRAGQVVRLQEGDPHRQTNYSAEPRETARRWIEAGAGWLHVVNLDGAFDQPDQANRRALQSILAEAAQGGVQVQFGGGLRSLEAIAAAFEAGVQRVMLGTLAVEQPAALEEALRRWGAERVGASLDARGGRVQVRGWQNATPATALELAQSLAAQGLRWLVFTDIARDGLQTGLNLPATVELARASGLRVIASGGVSSLADVDAARAAGLAGVIVGRALYEGSINPQKLFGRT
mgnify:CR=1 FL=1